MITNFIARLTTATQSDTMAALPDTAVDVATGDAFLGGVILLLVGVVLTADRLAADRR